jgi:MauM/NapG family ferredoxin protein
MKFRRITQAACFTIFLLLIALASYPYYDGLAVEMFLRLDPLIGVGTAVAARQVVPGLVTALVVLGTTLLLGRVFCGHACPMGTTLDLLEACLRPRRKAAAKISSYEATSNCRTWKYLVMAFIMAAGAGGVSLVFLGSPLSLITRFYGIVAHPILLLIGDSGMDLVSRLAGAMPSLNFVQIDQRAFATNMFVAAMLVGIALLAYYQPRFWCRNLCSSGALMGLCSRAPVLRRQVGESCSGCGRCVRECAMSAIPENPRKTVHSECIVCLKCMEICPESAISFASGSNDREGLPTHADPTRRGILLALGTGLGTAGLLRTSVGYPNISGREQLLADPELIRPPGSLPESEFLSKCVRCGECMKACPTNTLQPTWLKAGLEGLFSPVMLPRLAACAVHCNVCGKVCPTGAIRDLPLIEKQHAKVGTAWIARQKCLAWEQDKKCLVCDEVCPYKAVSFQPLTGHSNTVPFVLANNCTGCGWCETKCPVTGASAILVSIMGEIRLSTGSYVEKAREYGLVFKTKDNMVDRLSPGIFDAPTGPQQPEAVSPSPTTGESVLPPGFDPK